MGEDWGDAASRLAALREVGLEYQVPSITPCDVSSISLFCTACTLYRVFFSLDLHLKVLSTEKLILALS